MRLLGIIVVLSAILVFGIGSIRAAEPQVEANGLAGGAQSITGKDGAPMVLIPAGSFTMGSNDGLPAERPELVEVLEGFFEVLGGEGDGAGEGLEDQAQEGVGGEAIETSDVVGGEIELIWGPTGLGPLRTLGGLERGL